MASDIKYVVGLEQSADNFADITPWEATQHEAAIRFPDMRHFIIESLDDGMQAAGFAMLIGCRNPHKSIELKRLVVQHKQRGIGRAAVRMLKKVAFDELGAHRFWLDVKGQNTRAKALYDSEGFVQEGVLREAVKVATLPGGYDNLVVLSLLKTEFEARRALGVEALA
jgi:diamine N-acetyltransferase